MQVNVGWQRIGQRIRAHSRRLILQAKARIRGTPRCTDNDRIMCARQGLSRVKDVDHDITLHFGRTGDIDAVRCLVMELDVERVKAGRRLDQIAGYIGREHGQ